MNAPQSDSQYSKIRLERRGRVAVLTFADPTVMNAVGMDMLAELTAAVREVAASDARALLLTGEGRAFCSGANLSDDKRDLSGGGAGASLRTGYHPLFFMLRELEMPVISAVNGVAAGVGMSFALSADLVCAARSAYFLQAFARIGLIPDGGATWLLPRLVGMRRAMELSMLAEKLPAEQALEWGLINRVCDDDALMDEALELAGRLADGPRSLVLMRKAYWESLVNGYEAQLDLEARLQTEAGASEDFREGVLAFKEKRPAQFQGR